MTSVFLNIPVENLDASKAFFEKLGFTINPQFTDETAASVVISETIYVMLLTKEKMKDFTKKEIVDAKKATEILTALSFESKEKVDKMYENALAAGGKESRPSEDLGFMYGKYFEDLDGHIWELIWMDPTFIQK